MTITPSLFDAFLKCPTKCRLRANGETPSGNTYAEWVQSQNESFRATQTARLLAETPSGESASSPSPENLKASKWRLAAEVVAQAPACAAADRSSPASLGRVSLPGRTPGGTPGQPADGPSALPLDSALPVPHSAIESRLHAIERVPSEGRGKPAKFIPIRFIFRNKLTKDDRLLLAFDAFVLAAALGRDLALGKIIHGDDHAILKVKTSSLAGEVQKRLEKIAALLASPTPPDLILNRHCAECEFKECCRQKAIKKDDLSLLAGMSQKEHKKLRNKVFLLAESVALGGARLIRFIQEGFPLHPEPVIPSENKVTRIHCEQILPSLIAICVRNDLLK